MIDEDNYNDYVFSAYKMALSIMAKMIGTEDIDFKGIKDNEDNFEKMKWIIFQDILRNYKKNASD